MAMRCTRPANTGAKGFRVQVVHHDDSENCRGRHGRLTDSPPRHCGAPIVGAPR
jgi:hypothetical protein